jgi:hypothetical protein
MPSPAVNNGSEIQANALFEALVGAANAELPEIDLFDATHSVPWDEHSDVLARVEKLDVQNLISSFDAIMAGVGTQLKQEHDAGRITGAKYADVFLALVQGSLQSAVQFELGKDQAFWMAAKTQADAITSQNQNENIRLQAMLQRANYALTKLKLASEDSAFGSSEYQREYLLVAQKGMVDEQKEAQRAQTANNRSDGNAVTGLLGKQMELYDQQKKSYIEDIKIKASKIFADLWVTQKTMADGAESIEPDKYFEAKSSTGGGEKLTSIFAELRDTAMGTEKHTPDEATYNTTSVSVTPAP